MRIPLAILAALTFPATVQARVTWLRNPADQICVNPGAGGGGPIVERSPDVAFLPSFACAGGISPPITPFAPVGVVITGGPPLVYSALGAFLPPGGVAGASGVYLINSTYAIPDGDTIVDPAHPSDLAIGHDGLTEDDLLTVAGDAFSAMAHFPVVGPYFDLAADVIAAIQLVNGPIGDHIVDTVRAGVSAEVQSEIDAGVTEMLTHDLFSVPVPGDPPEDDGFPPDAFDVFDTGATPSVPSVPEIPTWAMMLAGFAGLGLWRARCLNA